MNSDTDILNISELGIGIPIPDQKIADLMADPTKGSGSGMCLRLVNGNGQCRGRVEILYNGAWGTVCDDYWDINAAQVVCRQLNCGQALAFNGSAAFGQGQGTIVLDDVQCTGNEQHVWDCQHQPFTVHNCGHNEDVGVVCSELGQDIPLEENYYCQGLPGSSRGFHINYDNEACNALAMKNMYGTVHINHLQYSTAR
ncbi:unnamed protein product [Ranitomeya imitator]|uniref:SRCR domain-containing protein n=1 Tax=Ranitomeya imitator TaxID=111125 RepID=A0ABN9MI17_9NEOB|nr:unnamed protein product [Ranitomeya imitator]